VLRAGRWALLLALLATTPAGAQIAGWSPLPVTDKKRPTIYEAITDAGRPAVHAIASGSASILARRADFDLRERPRLSWRWKVSRLIPGADNAVGSLEDSPVRIMLAFEGDISKLRPRDRAAIDLSKRLSGRALPYATLQYIWSNKSQPGSIIENPHTRRVQMIVASSGSAGVGEWQTIERDVVADFKRAFKEEPGRLAGYGVMSDTDNTGESVEAWYADIDFKPR
jgi:hypothetical protein